MTGRSVGDVTPQDLQFDEPLQLRSGASLGPMRCASRTYGQLNSARTNARARLPRTQRQSPRGRHLCRPGQRTSWVGQPRRPRQGPLDTDRFFVIGVNNLGSCFGSTGPMHVNPATGRVWGADFPVVTVHDGSMPRCACSTASASAPGCRAGRVLGRHAGAGLGAALPRAGRALHRHRHRAQSLGPEHRLQRGRATRHRDRPRLPRRPLLRARRGAEARPAWRA